MALAARSMGRLALSLTRRGPIAIPIRSFSVTPSTSRAKTPSASTLDDLPTMPEYSPELLSPEERSMYDMLSAEERVQFDAENRRIVAEFNDPQKRADALAELNREVANLDRGGLRFEDVREKRPGFWAEEEDDEFGLVEDADDEFREDEMTSMAHAEVELHRDIREWTRIAAWDMPFLSQLARPFTLPPDTHILRFRYTSYLGEQHPAESKVVMEVSAQDLAPKYLTAAQLQTLLKLVGPRYNPNTDIIRMSCEKFTTRAQNKRYLGDLINTLIKEAKEGDSFSDVPLDLRHQKPERKLRFPEAWKMTEERKKQLEAKCAERQQLEKERQALVDGKLVLAEAVRSLPSLNPALNAKATQEREKVAVKVGAKRLR
ncbi:mitochondrial 37S ribosomal protein mS35 [Aspergillus melleus]|uniref:mitochondrial 37S ribosomal protein mS35 n=1 Tax=Aspergillus melleus TaxID=138277 RepID=UPI001E8E5392|nr:37S ribosomal protein S24, mitochondrial [Aspergillus melleus]KAH8434951.1 37S ribosomal protein S24, mitochondrial [Aspergillus melleus]